MINKSSFIRIPLSGCDPLASTPLYDGSSIVLFGVQGSVKEFAAHDGWNVHVTESKEWLSWFAFKPWFQPPLGLAILPVAGEHSARLIPRSWRR